MTDLIIDALLDTLKLVPWLLVMHVAIEVFEYHAVSKIKLHKALRGKWAPLIGGACGILPQCGFGVVAADLYSRRSIRLGTAVAVFIATSDEAIPILLGNPTAHSLLKLGVLLGCKLAAALIAGYALDIIFRKKELTEVDPDAAVLHGCHHHELGEHTHEHTHEHAHGHAHEHEKHEKSGKNEKIICAEISQENSGIMETTQTQTEGENGAVSVADERDGAIENGQKNTVFCNEDEKNRKKPFDFQCFVLHPLLHTLTVTAYILAVNLLFAVLLFYVGENSLERFLTAAKFYQPLLAGLVGLIPNCAASVVLAQMFARGSITLGAAFAGLSVNAGLALAVLIKKNRPAVHNLYIALGLYAYSVSVGLLLSFLPAF